MLDRHRQIPEGLYQRLLEYLQLHAVTDTWSEELLREIEEEAVVGAKRAFGIAIVPR